MRPSPPQSVHADRLGHARFTLKHWEERLAVAMVDAADAGMDPEEVKKRADNRMTVAKARSIVKHIEECTVRKHKHLRLDKHRHSAASDPSNV